MAEDEKEEGLEDEYPVGSGAMPFKLPRYAKRILAHLNACFKERRCILCSACLSLALSLIEDLPPLPKRGEFYSIGRGNPYSRFALILCTTLPGDIMGYNACPYNRMKYEDVWELALFLLRLPPEKRRELRERVLTFDEEPEINPEGG